MGVLDSRWRYFLGRPLYPGEAEVVDSIPGLWRERSGAPYIDAPYDAAWLVEHLLRAWDIGFGLRAPNVVHPRPWSPEADEELVERILASGANDWLVREGLGPWTLRPFQREAIWFLLERQGSGYLRQEAGAGKTVQAAVVAALAQPGPVLVVTKDGQPVSQWRREVERFLRGVVALELRPPSRRRKKDPELLDYIDQRLHEGSRPVVVCGWSTIRVCLDEMKQVQRWSQIVYDEAHRAKSNARYKYHKDVDDRFQATRTISQSLAAFELAEKAEGRLCTSATPIPDRLRDLWGQYSLIAPKAWGKTRSRFAVRYCQPAEGQGDYFDDSGASNVEELQARMSFFVHDTPKAVSHGQLPPVRFEVVYIPPERQDKPATGFKALMTSLAKASARGDASASAQLREQQRMEAATRKRSVVVEDVEDAVASKTGKAKVLILTGRHQDCYALGEHLQKRLERTDVEVRWAIEKTEDGYALPSRDTRDEIKDWYVHHPGPCVLVATAKAWGESVDGLQDTDLMQIVMLPDGPGDLVQWKGRVNRLGQNRPVQIKVYVAEQTVDERSVEGLAEKVDVAAEVGATRSSPRPTTRSCASTSPAS